MDASLNPWEYNPDLTSERIITISQLIADIRHEALDEHDPTKGDGAWSYGCRAYERCKNKLTEKALEGVYPWLTTGPSVNLECLIMIGQTLVRFYKGLPDSQKLRSLSQAYDEIKQLSFPMYIEDSISLLWYLAVETAVDGEVISIRCVGQTASGQIICSWEVPLKPFIPTIGSLNAVPAEAVVQHAPVVTIPDNLIEKIANNV